VCSSDLKGETQLLNRDEDAAFDAVIEVPLSEVTEPILCAPNDPDDARLLSEVCDGWEVDHLEGVQSPKIDEVFIGSCMTNIGHFRAAGKLLKASGKPATAKLWVAPPTKMDEQQLTAEGYYSIYGSAGARTEMPGCSLCMGNQARVADNCTVVSTSTRNFPNRLGNGANVFLSSAEVATASAILGKLPTPAEYLEISSKLEESAEDKADTYRKHTRTHSTQAPPPFYPSTLLLAPSTQPTPCACASIDRPVSERESLCCALQVT
jgi:aconitate hydratase 2/2-methylisocitrate dehydratase